MNLTAVASIYRFEMARFFRTIAQSIISPVLSTSLYFVVFGAAIGSRITTPCVASWTGWSPYTVASCCGKGIRSAAAGCRSCFRGDCRTSTWARRMVRVAQRTCNRRWKRSWAVSGTTTGSRTGASRAATSPGTTVHRVMAWTPCSWRSASAATWMGAPPPTCRSARRCWSRSWLH